MNTPSAAVIAQIVGLVLIGVGLALSPLWFVLIAVGSTVTVVGTVAEFAKGRERAR